MTGKIAKTVKLSAIVALLVFMAMGLDELYGNNQAYADLYKFEKLLDEIGEEVFSTIDSTEPFPNPAQSIPVEQIDGHFAHLESFDKVIRAI